MPFFSEFPASRRRQHCIEGMLIMMMMNCPVADVALMILPGGRETSHHQDSWHIPPIEGCLRSLELLQRKSQIFMYCKTKLNCGPAAQ